MKSFGQELRGLRDAYKMTQAKFSKQIGINSSTYHALESGAVSAQSQSAQKVISSSGLTPFERLLLRKAIEKESKLTEIVITDADRVAYQARKNKQYFKEMKKKRNEKREFKRAIPKTMTQKIFY